MSERRKSKAATKCYMCAAEGPTAEHVPPRSFFPKGYRGGLWTVPSCTAHNYDNSLDVEYVRNVITIQINCKGAAQEATLSKVFRAFDYSPKLLTRTFRGLKPITVDGEVTGSFSFDLPRFKSVMEAIAHAIYYKETGEMYQGEWEIFSPNLLSDESVFQGVPDVWEQFRDFMNSVPFTLRATPQPEVFKYGIHKFDDNVHFAYAFLFYEGFTIYVWTAETGTAEVEENTEMQDAETPDRSESGQEDKATSDTADTIDVEALERENEQFFEKAERAFKALFDAARAKNEIHFALALGPENRGYKSVPSSTAMETFRAFDEYVDFLKTGETTRFKIRVALSFYTHLSEASGFYEVPKNMLRIADGEDYTIQPFESLVQKHKITGDRIAPNTNKVFKDLIGHAENSGFTELAEVFRDAFNSELRNGYAHADYIIQPDGIKLRERTGGKRHVISVPLFDQLFNRGIGFFQVLRHVIQEYVASYNPAKIVMGRLSDEPIGPCTIEYLPEHQAFVIAGPGNYWRWVTDVRDLFAAQVK